MTHFLRRRQFSLALGSLLAASLACSTVLPGAKPTTAPNATAIITEIFLAPSETPLATATGEAPAPTETTEAPAATKTPWPEGVNTLPECAILTQTDAEAVLGEPAGAPKEGGGVCIYSDAATQVHVVSAYAAQGDAAIGKMNGRIFQLSAFGMLFDPGMVADLTTLDQAADHRPYLEKLAELTTGNSSFSVQSPTGVGDYAYWAWKDFAGGLHQGFIVAVRGDVLAGVDVVLGDGQDEATVLAAVSTVLNQIFDYLPPEFVIGTAEPEGTATEVPGGLIAFESDRGGGVYNLWTMNNDGTNQTQLTDNGLASSREPAWSPDGTQIIFTGQVTTDEASAEIYLINADGSGQTQLTSNDTADESASWSPDGTQIVFLSRRDGNNEVYLMQADGSAPVRLTNTPDADELQPVFSPDGAWIAYTSPQTGLYHIYKMLPDGSAVTQLTTDEGIHSRPAWSPDGTRIAFRHRTDLGSNIVVMDTDGGNQVDLTHNALLNYAPAWSPDGSALAFLIIDANGGSDIYRMNADGSNVTQLTISPAHDNQPAWQP